MVALSSREPAMRHENRVAIVSGLHKAMAATCGCQDWQTDDECQGMLKVLSAAGVAMAAGPGAIKRLGDTCQAWLAAESGEHPTMPGLEEAQEV